MALTELWVAAAVTWLAVISPGADFAIVSRNSSVHGRKAGIATSAGIAFGCWVHVAYAMFGLALLTQFLPDYFLYIQIVGAVYLVYVGVTTMISGSSAEEGGQEPAALPGWKYYGNGFFTNSLNPKTSLFVISLYSQVIGTATPLKWQILWGAFISVSHLLWFMFVSVFMSAPVIRSRILRHQGVFNGVIGAVLVALGLILFFSGRMEV